MYILSVIVTGYVWLAIWNSCVIIKLSYVEIRIETGYSRISNVVTKSFIDTMLQTLLVFFMIVIR